MEFIKICDKELYSVLNNNIKKITYNMCKSQHEERTVYGIQLKSDVNGEENCEIIENVSTNMELVLKIINCLSQNGVDNICFRDVVKDLMLEV